MPTTTVELTGEEARLLKSLDRVIAKERELGQSAAEAGDKSTRGGEISRKAWEYANKTQESTTAGLGRMVAQLGLVAAAAGAAKKAIGEMHRANEESAQKQRASEMGMTQLAQLSGGSKQKMLRLTDAARQLYAGGGAGSLNEAAGMIFQLESAGMFEQRDLFGSLYGVVGSPGTMAKAANTLMTSMGKGETGGVRGILSKAMAASAFNPQAADQLLEAAAGAGVSARKLGISDEEVLAATALLAQSTGSAQEGGTQLNSLLTAMLKKGGYEGLGLSGALGKLGGKGMSDKALIKYLGRKEAASAFGVLGAQGEQFQNILGSVREAEGSDLIGRIIETAQTTDPEIMAARSARMSEAQKELARAKRGVQKNQADALYQQMLREREESGGSALGTAFFEASASSRRWLFGDDSFMNAYGTEGEKRRYRMGDAEVRRNARLADEANVQAPPGIKVTVQHEEDPSAGME